MDLKLRIGEDERKLCIESALFLEHGAPANCREGLANIDLCILEILGSDFTPQVLTIKDVAHVRGLKFEDFKKSIKKIDTARKKILGEDYVKLTPEQMVYKALFRVLWCDFNKFGDHIEKFLANNIGDYFEIEAVETPHDLCCYNFLANYLRHCFRVEDGLDGVSTSYTSFSRYLEYCNHNAYVTKAHLKNYFKKNSWWNAEDVREKLFGELRDEPTACEVTRCGLEALRKLRDQKALDAAADEYRKELTREHPFCAMKCLI